MRRLLEKRIERLEEAAGIVTRHCSKPCIACLIVVQGTKQNALELCDGVSHRQTLEDLASAASRIRLNRSLGTRTGSGGDEQSGATTSHTSLLVLRAGRPARSPQAAKIRRALGGPEGILDDFPDRPKGVHWRTYERLYRRCEAYERPVFATMERLCALLNEVEAGGRLPPGYEAGSRRTMTPSEHR